MESINFVSSREVSDPIYNVSVWEKSPNLNVKTASSDIGLGNNQSFWRREPTRR